MIVRALRQHFKESHFPTPNKVGFRGFGTAFQDFDYRVNYYEALGVHDRATEAEVKRAFYALAKKYHPDANSGKPDTSHEERFKQISNAYDVLGDAEKRR